jgi:hypothetical protein
LLQADRIDPEARLLKYKKSFPMGMTEADFVRVIEEPCVLPAYSYDSRGNIDVYNTGRLVAGHVKSPFSVLVCACCVLGNVAVLHAHKQFE